MSVASILGIAAIVAGGATGCGDTAATVTASEIDASMYASHQFGYSFKYPVRCKLVKLRPDANRGEEPLEQVIVADSSGMVVDGVALDVFAVSVYRVNPAAGPNDLVEHQGEFQRMALGLVGGPPGLELVARPSRATFAGQWAVECEYFSKVAGQRVGTIAYFVPEGGRAFWIRLQSSPKTRGSSTLVVALSTFSFQ